MNLDRRQFVAGLMSAASAVAGFVGILRKHQPALPYVFRVAERGVFTNRFVVVTAPDADMFEAMRTPGVPRLNEQFDGSLVVTKLITPCDEQGRWVVEIETLT